MSLRKTQLLSQIELFFDLFLVKNPKPITSTALNFGQKHNPFDHGFSLDPKNPISAFTARFSKNKKFNFYFFSKNKNFNFYFSKIPEKS